MFCFRSSRYFFFSDSIYYLLFLFLDFLHLSPIYLVTGCFLIPSPFAYNLIFFILSLPQFNMLFYDDLGVTFVLTHKSKVFFCLLNLNNISKFLLTGFLDYSKMCIKTCESLHCSVSPVSRLKTSVSLSLCFPWCMSKIKC